MNAGCAGKTVRSLENACHIWAPERCDHDKALYKSTFTLPYISVRYWPWHLVNAYIHLRHSLTYLLNLWWLIRDGCCAETPLSLSASLSRPRSVMLVLISGGAILDYRNGRSLTAVHVAVMRGNRDALMVRIHHQTVAAAITTNPSRRRLFANQRAKNQNLLGEYSQDHNQKFISEWGWVFLVSFIHFPFPSPYFPFPLPLKSS